MRKILQVMAVIISGALLSDAFAAAAPAAPPVPTYGGAVAPDPKSNGQVMSNDAFNGTVNKLGTETNKKLNETVQQQLKATAPPPSSPTSTDSNDADAKSKQNGDDTDAEGNAANKAPKTQPAPAPQAVAQPAAPPAQQSSQPATSSDVYTGFGSGGQTNQKSNSSGGSQDSKSSNWNVGY